ncbi:MAG: PQQ-binding-like beta-propeller repeat protein [Pirellulales bacterium]|nr:PQQ-binding-like beta-propeller repeat protein [Pirellulales bacterium]
MPLILKMGCRWCLWVLAPLLSNSIPFSSALSQQLFPPPDADKPTVELSEAVQVDQLDPAALSLLEVAKGLIAQQQWDDAIEKLEQVEHTAGDKLFEAEPRHYIPLRRYCQRLVSRFPTAGLTAYRKRVDPLAKVWYDDGVASCNAHLLQKLTDSYYNSSYGDDALLALGEMAIERGEPQKAFSLWVQISHKLHPAGGLPMWLAYPDTDLNLADVRARLVLASILKRDLRWAKVELNGLEQFHPGAKGKLGGREVVYAAALAEMIEEAKNWRQSSTSSPDWPTFAGSPSRQRILPRAANPTTHHVEIQLPGRVRLAPEDSSAAAGRSRAALPVYIPNYPVVADGILAVCTENDAFAFHLESGKPAWLGDSDKPGRIFRGTVDRNVPGDQVSYRSNWATSAERFPPTIFDRWLLARMGADAIGHRSGRRGAFDASSIICLDLQAEGRLHWTLVPDDDRWQFEGSPVCDGTNIYVAMRYRNDDAKVQEHVACFDLQTGKRRWRRFVCAAQPPTIGVARDGSRNLLTLAGKELYLNTNLGAIAAIDTAEGFVRWVTVYTRKSHVQLEASIHSEPNPAIYDRGMIFAAPVDFAGIVALDAFTGQFIWDNQELADATQLIGVCEGKLWSCGKSLCALEARSGKLVYHSASVAQADDEATVTGHGRCLLAGGKVYWPVKIEAGNGDRVRPEYQILVLDAQTAEKLLPIRLSEMNPPCESGNLLMASRHLIIDANDRMVIFELSQQADNDSVD